MKIDFYISSLSGGGAEKVLISIAQRLAALENDVSIISLEKRPQFYSVDTNVKLYKYENKESGIKVFLKDLKAIKTHMVDSNADISISFLLRCNLLVLIAGMFSKRKIIVSDRNNPLKEHSKVMFFLQNILYLRADRIIVQTEQIKKYYRSFLKNKIHVIENPIDTLALDSQVEEMPEREKVIISIGRLEPQKDYKTLMDAFVPIHEKYSDWKVKVFGYGEMKEELENYAKEKGIQDSFIYCGRTDKPFFELCKASIFVLSSFYEGFPNVLCEAMYAGNLCIASDCVSGPRELIENGKNGWLFPVADVKSLTMLIEQCIRQENDYHEIREEAKKTVSRLHLSKNIDKWIDVIKG